MSRGNPRRSNVTPIGCFTSDWMRGIDVAPSIELALAQDPSLDRVLFQALHRHTARLPRVLARGGQVSTTAWKGRGRIPDAVISTFCSAHAVVQSVIHSVPPPPRKGKR